MTTDLPEGFMNPLEEIRVTKNLLPHWQQPGALYFITFRLGDSLPRQVVERLHLEQEEWIQRHPKPWTPAQLEQFERRYQWLIEETFQGHGSCLLRDPAARERLIKVLTLKDGERYHHFSWVIMPNHVHLLTKFAQNQTLEKLLQAWKGTSSRAINNLSGAYGSIWQDAYRDTLIRDLSHFSNCVRYIRKNPPKAGLKPGEHTLYESAIAREIC